MATSGDLYDLLETLFVRLLNLAESDGMDSLIELDLSFSQARTLFCLAHNCDAMPIHAIADRLTLSDAAAGRNVDQLVKLDLVERRESPDDRRVKLISLSPAGQKIAAQHFESKTASIRAFTEKLPADQREQLYEALAAILAGEALRPGPQGPDDQETCI
ncbi:MAG: MarR family winged helix-turn-helix transcriptional regulator [Aeromicrobium sp.]